MLWEYYLCSCIDTILKKQPSGFPLPAYLRQGRFAASFDRMKVKKIRLYNTQGVYLHLRGAEIYDGSVRLEESALFPYEVSHGRLYKDSGFSFKFNTIAEPYMFHTEKSLQDNWVEIEFSNPVEMTSLVLYGRIDGSYMRSNCLAADVTDENGRTATVFDYQNILEENVETVFRKLSANPVVFRFSAEQIELLCRILLFARNESFWNMKTWLLQLEELGFASTMAKRYINEHILAGTKRQFTMNWGCQYTYNLWSQKEKKDYIKAGLDVISLIKPVTDNVFFAYGTLLGFIREPDQFIPHDSDIDIIVVGKRSQFKDIHGLSMAVRSHLKAQGVVFAAEYDSGCHVKYHNSRRFDLFFRLEDPDGNINIDPRLGVYMDINECYPPLCIDVLGYPCPIPKNPFTFLEKIYGKDWRIPQDKNIYKKEHGESFQVRVSDSLLIEEAMQVMEMNEKLFFYRGVSDN